ncbi:hypothetical protein AB0O82_35120 [Kitasatospora sp. NPDC088264]|uniref:hypothetical protein n=1 Tax=Kitasatospora sp. NPDC088264 TaxID=3155296 RepID=UPI0034405CD9
MTAPPTSRPTSPPPDPDPDSTAPYVVQAVHHGAAVYGATGDVNITFQLLQTPADRWGSGDRPVSIAAHVFELALDELTLRLRSYWRRLVGPTGLTTPPDSRGGTDSWR